MMVEPLLSPVVTTFSTSSQATTFPCSLRTVQGCNQIDLVDTGSMSVTKNGVENLSLLDVFSQFLELRSLSSKDSNKVLMRLRGTFR